MMRKGADGDKLASRVTPPHDPTVSQATLGSSEMPAKRLESAAVGLPRFDLPKAAEANVFALTSHQRAKEALEFGLSIDEPGFNIFVVGEDRSSRMNSTLEFLNDVVAERPAPSDWLYLNNFRRPHRPKPHELPAGIGEKFRQRMAALIPQLREALSRGFDSEEYQAEVRAAGEKVQREIMERFDVLRQEAEGQGLRILETASGMQVVALSPDGQVVRIEDLPTEQRKPLRDAAGKITQKMAEINRWAIERRTAFVSWVQDSNRQMAENTIGGLLDSVVTDFQGYPSLTRWLVELRVDILDNLALFRPPEAGAGAANHEQAERRYAVNLLVDNSDAQHQNVVLEANPTYENLFGRIEYRSLGGALMTDFTMIRGGALHRANGGILVLRAEALTADPVVWGALKAALRDRKIRIEERHRSGSVPLSEAPTPKAIPLDVKVVIIGAPRWYYTFFSADPEFQNYFKVKADIDAALEASPENLACYVALIEQMAASRGDYTCEPDAVSRLLGIAAMMSDRRDKLTSQIERVEDVLREAMRRCPSEGPAVITDALVAAAHANRRRRNARTEDRLQEEIARGTILIDTTGEVVGQVNALTVRDLGDHVFGTPARVTARASIGRRGVINIERDTDLGGPIQQKGAMVLQGFLAGHFARRLPIAFNCSITFEQSYGGVEGDSASMAELLATLSDLSGLPLRQDLAITGSVNQRGQSQAVGGVRHKVAGFYRTCLEAGGLTGTQGVVVPAANEVHLILDDEVAVAVAEGRFHVWSVETVEQAIELFTGQPVGEPDAEGAYPPDSVYGLVFAQLEAFDRILASREQPAQV
jgi:predicted ATP-dependent protease